MGAAVGSVSSPDDGSRRALWPPLDHRDRVGSERHFHHHSVTATVVMQHRTWTASSALGASTSRCHSPRLFWLHPAMLDASDPTKRGGLRRPSRLEVRVAHLWHTRVRNAGQQGQPVSSNQAQNGGSRAFRAGFGRSHNPSVQGSSPCCPTGVSAAQLGLGQASLNPPEHGPVAHLWHSAWNRRDTALR
jgi:hypothetical protein